MYTLSDANIRRIRRRSFTKVIELHGSKEVLTPRDFIVETPTSVPHQSEPKRPLGQTCEFAQKWTRIAVLVFCGAFCTVLLASMILRYFAYPSVVNVKVEILEDIMEILPGVTVCSNNRIRKQDLGRVRKPVKKMIAQIESSNMSYILKYQAEADLFEKEVFEHFDAKPLITHFISAKKLARSTYLFTDLQCNKQTWIPQGKISTNMRDSCSNVYKARTVEKSGACYTLFHKAGMINYDYWIRGMEKAERSKIWKAGLDMYYKQDKDTIMRMVAGNKGYSGYNYQKNGLLTMALDFNLMSPPGFRPNQTTNLKEQLGGKLWVHSNRVIPWMSTTGFNIFPGKKYTLYIKKITTKNIKAPYTTKCRNYTGEYLKQQQKRGFGMDLATPMSREACRDDCIGSMFVEKQNCWPNVIPFRKENQTATNRTTVKWCPASRDINGDIGSYRKECDKQCPTDCLVENYDIRLKEQTNPDPLEMEFVKDTIGMEKLVKDYNIWQPMAIVDVIYSTVEETVYQHEPSFSILPFIVETAGYVGLFFSLSALDIYDFVAYIVAAAFKRF